VKTPECRVFIPVSVWAKIAILRLEILILHSNGYSMNTAICFTNSSSISYTAEGDGKPEQKEEKNQIQHWIDNPLDIKLLQSRLAE
jgi:hypothetical protein